MEERRHRSFFWLGLALLAVLCVGSCKRVGPLVIDGAGVEGPAAAARLHYFFDKTLSMRGFTAQGEKSEYFKALPALWDAAVGAFPSSKRDEDEHYYAYVVTVSEFKSDAVTRMKRELFQPGFYNGSAPAGSGIVEVYRRNDEQPFTAAAEYAKTLYEQPDSAVIIVTDLYEQYREDPFSAFFREAFSRRLSCAFFAVESSFAGKIYSVSRVNTGTREISVPDGGKSTFFICIAGDSRVVSSYCASLAKELSRNNVTFNDAVFMVAQGENIKPRVSQPVPSNKREFADSKNAVRSMNIDREDLGRNVQSYRLLKFDSSRWAAGLALSNVNHTNFTYNPGFELFLWSKQSKDGSNEWRQLSDSGNVGVKMKRGSKIPLYIVVDTKNKSLDAGYYKIKYKITSSAKTTPEWVADLDAPDIQTLEASAKESAASGAGVKVLQVKNVYEKIAEAFNSVTAKTIYSGELYLIKR